jgi:hypothetical protein
MTNTIKDWTNAYFLIEKIVSHMALQKIPQSDKYLDGYE